MFCREALKNSLTFFLKPFLRWSPITPQTRQKLHYCFSAFLFNSHSRLMIAVSYNLWISADHRCWLVGCWAFLIKRQMSGGAWGTHIFTLWHYKSWHRFKIFCLLCFPFAWEIIGAKSNTSGVFAMTGGSTITFLATFCSYICAAKLDFEVRSLVWVWEIGYNEYLCYVHHSDTGIYK